MTLDGSGSGPLTDTLGSPNVVMQFGRDIAGASTVEIHPAPDLEVDQSHECIGAVDAIRGVIGEH